MSEVVKNRIQVFLEFDPSPRVQLKFEESTQAEAYFKMIQRSAKAGVSDISGRDVYMTLPPTMRKLEARPSLGGFSFIFNDAEAAGTWTDALWVCVSKTGLKTLCIKRDWTPGGLNRALGVEGGAGDDEKGGPKVVGSAKPSRH
ncbi:hypothetical protein AUP68_04558 [Ilyonectria robusta]